MARFGELLAARFLAGRGVSIIGRNVRVGRSEIDVVGEVRGRPVAFEVKTVVVRHPSDDGIYQVSSDKLAAVRRGIRELSRGAGRVDVVTIGLDEDGAAIRWIRDARW